MISVIRIWEFPEFLRKMQRHTYKMFKNIQDVHEIFKLVIVPYIS